ncbi:MAG TPA: DUF1345 domain-containing protein [Steroidobacteraceae bacterium]|nr:DUF1345 domain-containing protein [Steroidobacteraceae bacterium]
MADGKSGPARTGGARSRSAMQLLLRNHVRFWSAMLAGVLIFCLVPPHWSVLMRLLTAWNGAVLLFLPATYFALRRLDARQMRARYAEEDPTAPVILVVVIVAAILSVMSIVVFLSTLKEFGTAERCVHIVLASLTVVDSWLLVPTMFTLHYADLYYSVDPRDPPLSFPGTKEPLLWDFLYFSFTIAAACQTADVATNEVGVRKVVTLHSVISFLFNVSILGFAINVSAGLLGGG